MECGNTIFFDENRGGVGIHFSSHYNTVIQNRMANGMYGMVLNNADSNQISQNFMSHLELGICFQINTDYNNVIGNNIKNCSEGVELRQASHNRFFHNIFNNSQQVVISNYGYVNFWDDGYPSGGNYWSDYNGTDVDSDGIGDTSYYIDEYNQDNYPLITPFISLEEMRAQYSDLMSTYHAIINELNNIRNIMYVFIGTTIALLTTIVYIVIKKSV